MAKLKIPPGTKLDLAYDTDKSDTYSMKSTFEKPLTDISFLISAPVKSNSYIELDCFKLIMIRYKMPGGSQLLTAYAESPVIVGKRVFWKMRLASAPKEYIARIDKRYTVRVKLEYSTLMWDPDNPNSGEKYPAESSDISAGGISFFLPNEPKVGEILNVIFPKSGTVKGVMQRAEVCWIRAAKKGSPYKNVAGLKYIYTDEQEKTNLMKYINMAIVKYAV